VSTARTNLLNPTLPSSPEKALYAGQLYGSAQGLLLAKAAQQHDGPLLVVTDDMASAHRLELEAKFYLGDNSRTILHFPDWETLPYDTFSPHQDIVSERLQTLHQLPDFKQGILFVPIATLMQRIAPRAFLEGNTLMLNTGDQFDIEQWRMRLEKAGYRNVSQVMEHGEFTVRGAIIDLYPMGSKLPYRIDLFDDEIDTLRTFDPETQRSIKTIDSIRLLPAREFPMTEDGIQLFRQQFRRHFEGDPQRSFIYREVSDGNVPGGIEYYLPLFFEETSTLLDYLPDNTLLVSIADPHHGADTFWQEISERYRQHRVDIERPLLEPKHVFVPVEDLFASFKQYPHLHLRNFEQENKAGHLNYASLLPPQLTMNVRRDKPCEALEEFIAGFNGRVLFAAESAGRRETLLDMLRQHGIQLNPVKNWDAFVNGDDKLAITVAPLEQGLILPELNIAVIAEPQLFGQQVMQRRRRSRKKRDTDAIIRNLAELSVGDAVVHEDHGVGRFLGLQTLDIGDVTAEYMSLEYAKGDKLYVPVASLDLISRYSGAAPELAPCINSALASGKKRENVLRKKPATWLPNCWKSMPAAPLTKNLRWRCRVKTMPPLPMPFRLKQRPISRMPLMPSSRTCCRNSLWIAWSAVMSALVRRKWLCVRPFSPYIQASK
jgi:transcription-repair coupling factor (superfamily II helicase)